MNAFEGAAGVAPLLPALNALTAIAGGDASAFLKVAAYLGAQLLESTAQAQGAPMKFVLDVQHAQASEGKGADRRAGG